jgi:hypothetical protein
MSTDFRALCAELVEAYAYLIDRYMMAPSNKDALVYRARTALAQPEPQGPTVIGPEWQPCVKLPITVHVREQRPGETHSSTREGITPLRPDDLIMRGVRGEEYPIGRELFNQTYRMGAALAQPEPAAPTDGELPMPAAIRDMPEQQQRWYALGWRAAQARYARPAIEPVPVSERLPGPEDRDPKLQRCWWLYPGFQESWKLCSRPREGVTHWLPHHALPLPQGGDVEG